MFQKRVKLKKKNGQVLYKAQVRLSLTNSGGTFYQIQTDIYIYIYMLSKLQQGCLAEHNFFRGSINNWIPHGIDNKMNET